MNTNNTKSIKSPASRSCLARLVLDGLRWWRTRRMKITDVSLGINEEGVKVWAMVDGYSVKIFDESAKSSTLYCNTREAVYMARYPKENSQDDS